MQKIILLIASLAISAESILAQSANQPKQRANTRFEQLGPTLPTPNTYRTAAGSPGKDYFQNRADYDIKATLDDTKQKITGSETVTYYNKSADALPYLWLQLDQNLFRPDADGNTGDPTSINAHQRNTLRQIDPGASLVNKDYGHKITAVRDQTGKPLKYTINQTMMRIDLPQAVAPGKSTTFSIDWNFKIVDVKSVGAR